MICNKKEWEILDNVQVTLLKFAPMMNERNKARANALIYLCKENPDYARPERERKVRKTLDK